MAGLFRTRCPCWSCPSTPPAPSSPGPAPATCAGCRTGAEARRLPGSNACRPAAEGAAGGAAWRALAAQRASGSEPVCHRCTWHCLCLWRVLLPVLPQLVLMPLGRHLRFFFCMTPAVRTAHLRSSIASTVAVTSSGGRSEWSGLSLRGRVSRGPGRGQASALWGWGRAAAAAPAATAPPSMPAPGSQPSTARRRCGLQVHPSPPEPYSGVVQRRRLRLRRKQQQRRQEACGTGSRCPPVPVGNVARQGVQVLQYPPDAHVAPGVAVCAVPCTVRSQGPDSGVARARPRRTGAPASPGCTACMLQAAGSGSGGPLGTMPGDPAVQQAQQPSASPAGQTHSARAGRCRPQRGRSLPCAPLVGG